MELHENESTSPPVAKPAQRAPEREDEDFERPKGKLLLFWGCSEKARPGSPERAFFCAAIALAQSVVAPPSTTSG